MKINRSILVLSVVSMWLLAGCGSGKKVSRVTRPTGVDMPVVVAPIKVKGIDASTAKALEREARTWLGVKYKYGGESKKGTDCSGLVMSVFLKVTEIKLPRSSAEQQQYCKRVDRNKLAPGDLVFFSTSKNGRVSHVGLYIGGGDFIHASTSRGVIVSNLDEKYYANHYHSAGRVPAINEQSVEIIQAPAVAPHRVTFDTPAKKSVDDRDDIYRSRKDNSTPARPATDSDPERDDIYRSRKSKSTKHKPAPKAPENEISIPLDSLPAVPPAEPDIRNTVKNAF